MTSQTGNPTDFESFLTWEALTDVLSYDPATGEFRWVKSGRLGWKNRLAGTIDKASGYCRIEILGRSFYASRLAWLFMKKRWPKGYIDHINGDRRDDRWTNLREVDRQQNSLNRGVGKNSRTGINGVYAQGGKWIARAGFGGTRFNLGLYDTLEAAKAAREAFELANFGGYHRSVDQISLAPIVAPAELPQSEKRASAKRGIPSDFESALTQEIIVRLLSYNPATGEFIWRSNETNPRRIKIGQPAGRVSTTSGYISIQIMGRKFVAHRLAWLYMTGKWPTELVDHINQEKTDNRWENLRAASHSENGYNRYRATTRSKLGRGIYQRENGRFRVAIGKDGKTVNLGTFDSIDDARKARDEYCRQKAIVLSKTAYRGAP